jgi:hypothetical protein
MSGNTNTQGSSQPGSQPVGQGADAVTTAFNLIMQQWTAGAMPEDAFQTSLRALFSGVAASQNSSSDRTVLQRAKATVRAVVPEFMGDQTTTMTAGRWLEKFEAEATNAGLPTDDWPFAAVQLFPTGSAASLWAVSIFGGGLRFRATWETFRPAFVAQYTPANAVPMAQAAYESLSMAAFGNDILAFNREFNVLAVHFNNVLLDAGCPGLQARELVMSYSIKLRGPVKLHLDAVMRLRASTNRERELDQRPPIPFTIKDAFAETESFALQQAGDLSAFAPAPLPAAPTSTSTTIPMEIDSLRSEILAVVRQEVGRGRGRGRGDGKCWGCGGTGHLRRDCPSAKAAKEEAEKGKAQ